MACVPAAFVVVGANALGRLLARFLGETGSVAVVIDIDPDLCRVAEQAGLQVVPGNAVEDRTLRAAGIDGAKVMVAVTRNEGINLVCARKAMEDFRIRRAYVGVDRRRQGLSSDAVVEAGARMLFGAPCDLRAWIDLCERNLLTIERWQLQRRKKKEDVTRDLRHSGEPNGSPLLLPLLV